LAADIRRALAARAAINFFMGANEVISGMMTHRQCRRIPKALPKKKTDHYRPVIASNVTPPHLRDKIFDVDELAVEEVVGARESRSRGCRAGAPSRTPAAA
jgi:hypothetical protein